MLFQKEINKHYNCPQCGDALKLYFKYSKLIQCSSCGSSIFLEDQSVKLIGERSILTPEPSLIELHKPFSYQNRDYLPIGKIRYSYGRGFWEEWFLLNDKHEEYWLSIDEGDFVLERPTKFSLPFKKIENLKIGKRYGEYTVTEIGTGICVGFDGELPEDIELGKEHNYIHLSKGYGHLLTLEISNNKIKSFEGEWIDPLTIEVNNR